MRTVLLSVLLLAAGAAQSQIKHWTETSNETVWRGRYKNCDHGYLVNLPPGVVGHGSLAPLPNHGILISADNPSGTLEGTLEAPRLVDVYDSTDAAEIGSARAYLKQYDLKADTPSEKVTILKRRDIQFRGSQAVSVRFRKTDGDRTLEFEELVIYRKPKEIGPLFIVIMLKTTPESYVRDHSLFVRVRQGLEFIPVPEGECSND